MAYNYTVTDPYYDDGSTNANTIIAVIIAVPVLLILSCIACGVLIGVCCCRRRDKRQGIILSLPTTTSGQSQWDANTEHNVLRADPNLHVNNSFHNVPAMEEEAPAYEQLQIHTERPRVNPPPPTYTPPKNHDDEEANRDSTDEQYDYIPADDKDIPTRGQRANAAKHHPSPRHLVAERSENVTSSSVPPAKQYLTMSPSSGDPAPTENTDGYLAPSDSTDGYLAPTESTDYTDASSGPTQPESSCGKMVPLENRDDYLAPVDTLEYTDASSRPPHKESNNEKNK